MRETKTRQITSEACTWIAKLETGELSEQDNKAFYEWINRSPSHVEAITKIAHLSKDINIIANMSTSLKEVLQDPQPIFKSSNRRRLL